jgi:nitrile hydratase accessory protein
MRRDVADMHGVAELPRRNGELVFHEPWEGRAFGLAITASEAGAYDWEEFRQGLIGEIDTWESEHGTDHVEGGEWRYYSRWLASLERLLVAKGLVSQEELLRRMDDLEHEDDHGPDHHDHEGAH